MTYTLENITNTLEICETCTLDKCKPNHCYKISSIHFPSSAIKERLASFGVVRGALCTMLCIAPNKSTLSIQVNQTLVALREEEARLICVEPIS
ncbi:FeoA family protein [Helicobacter sp. T3_23-1059]